MRYYCICPAQIESGGPELTHQMCSELLSLGFEAYMYYIVENQLEPENVEACEKYKKYHTSHATDIREVEREDSIVLFNEGATAFIPHMKSCRKVLWWMSVDNYKDCTKETDLDIIRNQIEFHLVQSYYAYDYVKNVVGVAEEKIIYVSDYIGEKYMMKIDDAIPRMNMALYNPKKGLEKIVPLIEKTPWLKWIPLIKLTEEDMIAYMHIAKIYVDFGNHPGKDRIPREAAICGCCVITNREGSAAYYEDVPIPDQYKFSNVPEQYDEAAALIQDICNNYEKHVGSFEAYRQFIAAERNKFTFDVNKMVECIEKDMTENRGGKG